MHIHMIVYNRFFDYVTYVTANETDFNQNYSYLCSLSFHSDET